MRIRYSLSNGSHGSTSRTRTPGATAEHERTHEPSLLGVSRFSVLVDGEELGVHAISGLVADHAAPGTVVLWRPLGPSRAFYDWHRSGKPCQVTIRLHASHGEPAVEWELNRAVPRKWSAPDLDASSNNVALEELELVHEGLNWKEPPCPS